MNFFLVPIVAFIASVLTLFSGFGLGTVLMPTFAIFFSLPIAVTLTAIVHFLNNAFKVILLGKFSDKKIVLIFGIPAVCFAFIGAKILLFVEGFAPLLTYHIGSREAQVTFIKLLIATIMICCSLLEILPQYKHLNFDRKFLWIGGVGSGFLGGFCGFQGALRSAFLIHCGLSKESFIATGCVIALLVDLSRIGVYLPYLYQGEIPFDQSLLLVLVTIAAFLGTFLGNRWLKKVTIRFVQMIISGMLLLLAGLLALGII